MKTYPSGIQDVIDFHLRVSKTTGLVLGGMFILGSLVVGSVVFSSQTSPGAQKMVMACLAMLPGLALGVAAMKAIPANTKKKMDSIFSLMTEDPDSIQRVCEAHATAKLGIDKHTLTTSAVPWDGSLEFGPPPQMGNIRIWVFKDDDQKPVEFVIAPDKRRDLCYDMLTLLKAGNGETLWGDKTLRVKDLALPD